MQSGLLSARDATAAMRASGQPETERHQMKMTIFGATGGIGRHLVRQALAAGHKVTAVVRDPARFEVSHPALEVAAVPGLTDPGVLRYALQSSDAAISGVASVLALSAIRIRQRSGTELERYRCRRRTESASVRSSL